MLRRGLSALLSFTAFFALLMGGDILSAHAAKPVVELGIDVLAKNNFRGLEGKRVGLITNPSGVSASGKSTLEILRNAPNVKLVALFGPEHGVYGADLAGAYVASTTDKETGLTVNSLYGQTRKPTQEMLQGLDVLIYDIQDIGCRSYTFISTMGLAMEAAAEAGIEFYVLDRPNPLGGMRVEGMPLDPKFRSFVGQWDIPYVYGLTAGELARMINAQKWIAKRPKLTIVPMRGWTRSMHWRDTGLAWVPTSPHIPTADAALCYAITGILGEGCRISNGIGYTLPFGLVGLPGLTHFAMARELNAAGKPGLYFRPAAYKPFYGSFKDQTCLGVQLLITDPAKAELVPTAMHLLEALKRRQGGKLFTPATQEPMNMFDKVCGGDQVRKHFIAGKSAKEIITSWEPSLDSFRRLRAPYLIYPEKEKEVERPARSPSAAATSENKTTASKPAATKTPDTNDTSEVAKPAPASSKPAAAPIPKPATTPAPAKPALTATPAANLKTTTNAPVIPTPAKPKPKPKPKPAPAPASTSIPTIRP